ncbi:NAD-dependent epimerase/dehydratase family protein [Aspergillus clavatus NRRL 1]|uniref:NAD dependent epimerase/dehydratase family protein n=1 Tax=Aspergillus clavatus (strain ATCC 1007 / CBS 513.65 / DSM 816 / NCTC 3887 / NRRL 1 / QM 1276 / 107) TaxID=344612 RepID=A1C6S8_ASPCL|nr:NAD dependent epimerase/dehydratase family protein [Aspergillus clavatus NRRL 1]EAW14099.1 NAD dependent epimerase/dehydratase family protein [Aspergillus clavatus NRRL 1]
MPNVLILGGSGYLGFSIAKSLLRSGNHTVWGTARSPEKARLLLQNEVHPIEDDITDPVQLATLITQHSIDVVVDSTSAFEQAGQILQGVLDAATARRDTLKKENIVGPKLGYVYCSGLWVHGSPSSRVSDLSPVGSAQSKGKPATPVAWRPAHEQAILASRDVLDVAIMRPGTMYGRTSWVMDTWWGCLLAAKKSGSEETIQVPADFTARTGMVHVDDAAAAFHAAIDRLDSRLGAWPVFDLVTETIGIQEIMEAAKETLGIKARLEYTGTHGNPFLEALSLVSRSDASRARTVLGWEPRRREFILNLPVYLKAWEASQ